MDATPFSFLGNAGHLLRFLLIAIFFVFDAQKFTLVDFTGIAPLVSNNPLTSLLNVFGRQGASRVIGSLELTFGLLLALGSWRPSLRLVIVGACAAYLMTLSFLLTTPDVLAPNAAPISSGDVGLSLLKDIVLLAASIVPLGQSLARRTR